MKSDNKNAAAPPALPPARAPWLARALPWLMAALVILYFVSKTIPRAIPGPMNLSQAALIPVSYEGRVQPLDSLARNELLILSKITTLRSDWLRPSQVKDLAGLAKAIVEAGKSKDPSPGLHIWNNISEDQRKLLTTAAAATAEPDPQMQYSLLRLFNDLLDDEGRIARIQGGIARGTLPESTAAWRLYDAKAWKSVDLDDDQKDAVDKLAAWDKLNAEHDHDATGADHKHPRRPRTRPQVVDLNRTLLTAAFPDFVRAGSRASEPAMVWLMDVIADQGRANTHRVFRIEHERILELLDLDSRPGNFRYALDEFRDRMQQLDAEANLARRTPSKERDAYQSGLIDLAENLTRFMMLSQYQRPYWVPPPALKEDWKNFEQIAEEARSTGKVNPDAQAIMGFLTAHGDGDVKGFNEGVAAYYGRVSVGFESDVTRARYETFFNRFDVFDHLTKMYVVMFLLVAVSWILFQFPVWAVSLRRAAFITMIVLACFHLFGMASRSYLMDRPFVMVTNLYASAVFIGICTIIVALLIEKVQKLGIATAVAATVGFLTGIIALHLRGEGDTLEMQQAVLDTNFWLATHVTTVTFGYAATYLAGAFGIAYIIAGVFTKALGRTNLASGDPMSALRRGAGVGRVAIEAATVKGETLGKSLGRIIYGVICFALFLSFVGTVLGGIWADQSWGRFWGWDPKENGAVMIVIWNALILHARWAGMVQARGMAVLAIVGNIVTTWSWFGTNQLGAGLHSYGFMDKAVFWILVFIGTQLVIMALGLLPLKMWRSFSDTSARTPGRMPGLATAGLLIVLGAVGTLCAAMAM